MKIKDFEYILNQVNEIERNINFLCFSMRNALYQIKLEQNPLTLYNFNTIRLLNSSNLTIKANNCIREINTIELMAREVKRSTTISLNSIRELDSDIGRKFLNDDKKGIYGKIKEKNWFEKTGNYLIFGNYSGDVTLGGVFISAVIGFVGLDAPMDIRDITYNITHWKWTPAHFTDTALTAVSLVPVIGSLKYLGDGSKAINNLSEAGSIMNKIDIDTISDSKLIKKYENISLFSNKSHYTAQFTSNADFNISYHRPYIRKATRNAIEESTKLKDGGKYFDGRLFRDPNTFETLNDGYHIGHKTGYEYRKLERYAKANGFSQKQFNDFVNNPKFYQLESPASNMSHKYEYLYTSNNTKVDLNRLTLDNLNK